MLSVKDVSFEFRKNELVLHELAFSVRAGNMLAILGPNGAGKTTLLRCINAIIKPQDGMVRVENADVFRMNGREIAKKIGYVAQQNATGNMSVFDAVLLGRKPHVGLRSTQNDCLKVGGALRRLGLDHLAMRRVHQLSGGELQKVCIARAFVQEPKLFLLDEPTSNLDLKNQLDILHTIRRIVAEHDIAAVMTLHDINCALRFADQLLFLKNGGIAAVVTRETLTAELLSDVYGVKVELINHKGNVVVVPEVEP